MRPERPEARHSFRISAEAAGARLDRTLTGLLPHLTRSRIQALVAQSLVLLDGRPADSSDRVRAGQSIDVTIPRPVPATPAPEDIPLTVLHEDADILVIDKPSGLAIHPGAGRSSGTLVNALLHSVRDLSGVGGTLRPGIVHRLDAGTTGVLVVAKNDAAHVALARQFEKRTVEKEYVAVVHGRPPRAEGAIEAGIGRDPFHRKKMSTRSTRSREARSTYAVERALDGASVLRVRIHTGRTHQIRVHLASIGCPLVGDRLYGGGREPASRSASAREALRAFARPALHAARLTIDHPTTGARICFESPLPDDVRGLIADAAAPKDGAAGRP